jgi:hypothetical protein
MVARARARDSPLPLLKYRSHSGAVSSSSADVTFSTNMDAQTPGRKTRDSNCINTEGTTCQATSVLEIVRELRMAHPSIGVKKLVNAAKKATVLNTLTQTGKLAARTCAQRCPRSRPRRLR